MRFRFADFELDDERFELTRAGRPVSVQRKPLELLLHLLRRHPATPTKDELLDALWPDASVTESSVTRAARGLRRALGEGADSEGVIRTIRGRGYGIAVPVDVVGGRTHAAMPAEAGGIQRRLAAILSADAAGYSRLMAEDEVATVRLLEAHRRLMGERIEHHGGRVVDAVGDNLLAELPSVVEALECAVEIQAALEQSNAGLPEAQRMRFRIGVHVGDLLVDGARVFGDGINVTARIERHAQPGGICVSQAVVDQVRGKLEVGFGDLGVQRLKNIAEPLRLYRVTEPGEQTATAAPLLAYAGSSAPADRGFVGREGPLEDLEAALTGAAAGGAGMVFLVGEPGIGKTRLAEELAARAVMRGAEVLWGHCLEGDGAPALWPWVRIARAAVEVRSPETLRAQLGSRAGELAQVMPELRERIPDLPDPPSLDPEQERFRFFEGFAGFLARASKERPLVLVLEDLHWADESSLKLLRFLASELMGSRILVIGTYRQIGAKTDPELGERLAELARLPHARPSIELSGLSRDEVGRLVALASGEAPAASLVDQLHARTDGNPFFVSELLRLIEGRGGITNDSRAADFRADIPATVKTALRQRLASLSEDTRDLLSAAAVVGREVPLPILADALGRSEEDLFDALEKAEDAGLLQEHPENPESLVFSHALVQETLYDALSRRERVRLHRRVGEAIESLHARRIESFLPALAHHFRRTAFGEQFEKALDYVERAAAQAQSQLAFERAAELYEDAIRLLEARGAEDERRLAGMLLGRARALLDSGRPEEAEHLAWRCIEIARRLGAADLVIEAGRCMVGYLYTSAWGDELVQAIDEALRRLPVGDHAVRVRALAERCLAGHFTEPPDELDATSREAVEMARRLGDEEALRTAIPARLGVLLSSCEEEEPSRLCDEWEALARAAEDTVGEFQAHLYRLHRQLAMGCRDGFEREMTECDRLSADLRRNPTLEGHLRDARAMWALCRGRLEEAERLSSEAFEMMLRSDRLRAFGALSGKLGLLRRVQGRLPEFIEPVMIGQANSFAGYMFLAHRAGLGNLLLLAGRKGEARAALETALAADEHMDHPDLLYPLELAMLAEVAGWLDHEPGARRLYELLYPYRDRIACGFTSLVWGSAARGLGLLATTLGRFGEAEDHFRNGLVLERGMGFRYWEVHSLQDLARMRLRRDAPGDRDAARADLEESLRISDELGMKQLVESARSLLEQAAR